MPTPCTVTGTLNQLSGGLIGQGKILFQLTNVGTGNPIGVTGTSIIPQLTYSILTAQNGTFTVSLWGNDNINPSNTLYSVTFFDALGNSMGPVLYSITGASVNLNTAIAVSTTSPPVLIGGPAIVGVPLAPQTITGQPLTLTPSAPLNVARLESTNFYADQYAGGSFDVGLAINNTLAVLPSFGGYKFGTIRLDGFAPGSAWVWNTLVTISSPYVSIIGPGSAALQITASVLTGDHLRINTNPFIVSLAGTFGGFALVGGSQANAVGVHVGDIIGPKFLDLRCSNFTGTGAVGMWFDNVTNFTERVILDKVHMDGCTKGIRFTNTANIAGTASFGHHRWYSLWVNVGANQTGISYESGTLYSGTFSITMNLNATTSTAFAISGTTFSGSGIGSNWTGSLVNLNCETSAGSGTLFNVAAGCVVLIGGVVTSGGGLTNTGAGTLAIYPGNAITNADFSNSTLAAGVLVIGGTPAATNIPQFNANSGSAIAGITASNYFLLRAGVAGLEAHDTNGNVGLAGGLNTAGASRLFAQGSTALPTAALLANTAGSVTTVAVTGATTSMRLQWNLHATPVGVAGYGSSPVTIFAWLTAGNVNFLQVATTAVTPGAMSVDWTVF